MTEREQELEAALRNLVVSVGVQLGRLPHYAEMYAVRQAMDDARKALDAADRAVRP